MNHRCLVKAKLLYTFKGSLLTNKHGIQKAWSLVVISSGWMLSKPAVCGYTGSKAIIYYIFYQKNLDRTGCLLFVRVCLRDLV